MCLYHSSHAAQVAGGMPKSEGKLQSIGDSVRPKPPWFIMCPLSFYFLVMMAAERNRVLIGGGEPHTPLTGFIFEMVRIVPWGGPANAAR